MLALAALILVLTTAGATVEVPLDARLVVAHRPVAPPARPALAARYPAGWTIVASEAQHSALARRGGATWQADVKLAAEPGEPGVEIKVTITYLADVQVEREALELRLPAEAVRAVWRDGRLAAAPALLRGDRCRSSPRCRFASGRGARCRSSPRRRFAAGRGGGRARSGAPRRGSAAGRPARAEAA